jgi:4-hydroxy-2-oxoglutarate aldolase
VTAAVAPRFHGVFPAAVTPFQPDGALDLPAFSANLERYAREDLGGVLVLGSNGEAGSLEEDEKLALVKAARGLLGKKTLLVGTGLESTRATIALTRKVADLGADLALVLTPSYYKTKMTADVLRRHFEAVADASPIPIVLYSVPAFTGLPWPAGLAESLAPHPKVVGMKESAGDLALLGRIRTGTPETFTLACGSGPVFYPALCVGASAGVLAVAACAPASVAALFRAHESGDHAKARRLQEALSPLAVSVTATHGVAGLKAALDAAGMRGGAVRAPLLPVSDAVRQEIGALLAALPAA